jgi:hypothetical protein
MRHYSPNKNALLLTVPILFIVLTSGCTMPSGFCIPGLTCDATVEEANDVIVISSIQALPSSVPPDGTIKLVAIVENDADVNAEIREVDNINVELYDYCSGLFTLVSSSGGDDSSLDSGPVQTLSLLRGEKAQIEWNLKANSRDKVPVKTECELKIRARYNYSTKSITTLHLIDYAEMQREINEGTYSEVGSYISVGYGPIKPYVKVEGTQPIPVTDNKISTVLSLQIINKGSGFLSTAPGSSGEPTIPGGDIKLTAVESNIEALAKDLTECKDKNTKSNVKLINGESTKIVCPIDEMSVGNVPLESTKTITAEVSNYWYEFRKSITVTVEPVF